MATRIAVALEDDLDGGPADETVRFGVAGGRTWPAAKAGERAIGQAGPRRLGS